MTTLRTLSIEELAELTSDDAVRRRMDEQNSASLGRVALFLAGANAIAATRPFIFFLAGQREARTLIPAFLGMALAIGVASLNTAIAKDDRRPTWRRKHFRLLAACFIAIEFVLIMLAIGVPRGMMFLFLLGYLALYPFLVVLWFRFETIELVTLHGFLFVASTIHALQIPPHRDLPPAALLVLMAVGWNGGALAVGIRLTRSLAQSVAADHRSSSDAARMRNELRTARDLQLSMLPASPPSVEWADIAGISIPATEVGGDYYDYFVTKEGLAVVCADVAGHGLASGLTLATLRGALMLVADSISQPDKLLERLSSVVAQSSRRRMLATMTIAVFDAAARKATIGSAGHPPVIVKRANGVVETVDLFATPLGSRLFKNPSHREIAFASGDAFIFHSDGIYESMDRGGSQFGLDRLQRLAGSLDGSATAIRDGILNEISRYRDGLPQEDDVTLVVVKIN